jgi:5-hydroxyisourate hydrolase
VENRRKKIALLASPLSAAEISTHVLDLESGVGGEGISVALMKKNSDKTWTKVGEATTGENGRVKDFGDSALFSQGIYKVTFDMTTYSKARPTPFFPEIEIVFNVTDPSAHYHVPVVVSPYGYSTYRGN